MKRDMAFNYSCGVEVAECAYPNCKSGSITTPAREGRAKKMSKTESAFPPVGEHEQIRDVGMSLRDVAQKAYAVADAMLDVRAAERDRLKESNAELLESLKEVVTWMDSPDELAFSDAQLAKARAAIATAAVFHRNHDKNKKDNTRLIAAAPELLEALVALTTLFAHLASDSTAVNWIDNAIEAISKATGGTTAVRNQRMLRITQCSDPSLWYAGLVGELVPYCGQWREAYASREPAGYVNRVEFKDAEVVDVRGQQP